MMDSIKRYLRMMFYSARLVAGRKFWIIILIPLFWPILRAAIILFGGGDKLGPENAHLLMSLPLSLVGGGLGIRIIAGEVDSRTLEIAYTVPGGCHRVWLVKIAASVSILLASEVLLTIFTMIFFTSVTIGTFYGVLQASVFYLILGMASSAFFRSEITGAMVTGLFYALFVFIQLAVNDSNGGSAQFRISPFFNPVALVDKSQALAHTIQNRIFFLILIGIISLLAFSFVERREKMLGD